MQRQSPRHSWLKRSDSNPSFSRRSAPRRSTLLGVVITILLSCLVLVPSTLGDDSEGGLERLLRLLRDVEDLDREAARIRGIQIDNAIKRIYAKYAKDKVIQKIRRTFEQTSGS